MTSKRYSAMLEAQIKRGRRPKAPTMADKADKHVLYEKAVQCTEAEFEFVDGNFRRIRKRVPTVLREDFCGTANMCAEWVRRRRKNVAIGVDLDPAVLEWGRGHHIAKLTRSEQQRVTLLQKNVMDVKTEPADIILAMNFSYWIFKDRALMRRYFSSVRDGLVDDGILFLDAFGGYDAYRELKEKTEHKGFTYVWEHARFDPVTSDIDCAIHFEFPDRSRLKNAFEYHWRLWTLPELREILYEAGFKDVTIYWQGTDEKTGEGNNEFLPAARGDADAGWICFISAEK